MLRFRGFCLFISLSAAALCAGEPEAKSPPNADQLRAEQIARRYAVQSLGLSKTHVAKMKADCDGFSLADGRKMTIQFCRKEIRWVSQMLDWSRVLIPRIAVSVASGFTAQDDVKAERTKGRQLVIAAFELDVERVKMLLADGANPDTRLGFYDQHLFEDKWTLGSSPIGSDKWTPLLAVANSHRAPQPDKPTESTLEAREAAWKKLQAIDPKLIAEREKRRVAIAERLIAAKADLDSDDGFGATALYCSVQNRFDQLALLLIESNAKLDTKTGIYIDGPGDLAPVHYAVASPKVLAAMLKRGVNINVSSTCGETPLHWAVKGGDVEAVKRLLAAGADINAKDELGHLPSYWCTERNGPFDFPLSAGQKEIAQLLPGADLVPFEVADKWGFKDATGKIVVEPAYDSVRILSHGLAAVNVGASMQDYGTVWAQGGGKWGLIDVHGRLVVPITFDFIRDFSEGLALVLDDRGQRYIDPNGKVVVDIGNRNGGDFREGLAPVREYRPKTEDYQTKYIDKKGRNVIAVEGRGEEFHEGLAVLSVKPERPDQGVDEDHDLCGYIDRSGKVVIPPRFHAAEPFHEGLAAVRPTTTKAFGKGDLWGYIDKSGKYLIEPRFNDALPFEKGVAQVHVGGTAQLSYHGFLGWDGGQWQLIDRTGKVLKQLRVEDVKGLSPWR